MEIPVYLIAGFLDAGKTDFINGILQDGFARQDKTLLLCCEEGENEYDPRVLGNVTVVTVDEEKQLTTQFLRQCEDKHHPRQVLIEYNGMWMIERLYREVLPSNWVLYQVMTMVEAGTFEVYAQNMGQLMMEKIVNADMIVFNRCTPALRDALRRRNLKMVNRRADIFLENEDGTSEDYLTGNECPFDLTADVIDIPDEDFGVWYVDVMEHTQRYAGKVIRARVVMCHVPDYPGTSVLGRFAKVCCENDITFLGVVAQGEGLGAYANRDYLDMTAKIILGRHPAYGGSDGPILEVLSHSPCDKPAEDVISF